MTRDFPLRSASRARGLLLPLLASVTLAGCVASGYGYREDRGGGYYYGSPSVEYREAYPYGAYGYGGYGYSGGYGYPYGYPYGYYAPGYYVPRYYVVPVPQTAPPQQQPRQVPWRDLERVRGRRSTTPALPPPPPARPVPPRGPRPRPGRPPGPRSAASGAATVPPIPKPTSKACAGRRAPAS